MKEGLRPPKRNRDDLDVVDSSEGDEVRKDYWRQNERNKERERETDL